MKKKQILKWTILAIAVAINLFIIINAFINGEASAQESNTVAHTAADVVNTVKPETVTETNFDQFAFSIRKLFGHFGLFALSGFFSSWSLYLFLKNTKVNHFLWQLLFTFTFGFLVAIISEFAQTFVEGRTGSWLDVGIDSVGYFIGVFLGILIYLVRKLIVSKRAKTPGNPENF